MTDKQIVKGDKLIAEFMDIPYDKDSGVWNVGPTDQYPQCHPFYNISGDWWHYESYFESDNMAFSTSWDWLMPVVEEISNICSIKEDDFSIILSCGSFNIQKVYKRVVKIIKNYYIYNY